MKSSQLEKIRHSLSHLLAMAVLEKFPQAKLAIGPTIENGFYYDFDLAEKINVEALPALEKKMKALIKQNLAFVQSNETPDTAKKTMSRQPYKLELIDELVNNKAELSFYRSGDFIDLCSGPHVAATKEINPDSFKLIAVAGAYWRGDEKKQQLQRIYGVAFATKAELDAYLTQQAEALKRDHRKIGQELDLFTISPLVGSGLPMYTPRGVIMFRAITGLLNELETAYGYEFVDIPHLGKIDLYKTSGHWDKYKDSIFTVKGHGEDFVLKPMNCPHHMQIYASRPRSWRDLPVRYSEVTKQYRDEKAGELLGLSRVRSISIDDNHIFCRPDQLQDEMEHAYQIIKKFSGVFGFEHMIRLSIRDPKKKASYLGDDATWAKAEKELVKLLDRLGEKYVIGEGEASFYAPKIDFIQKDSLGRSWQLSTIQLDFVEPERFHLEYADDQGNKTRPAILHIAVAGSLERFLSIMIEHYAGAFPVWLSPVQVQLIPVGTRHEAACQKLAREFTALGIRTNVDMLNETVGNKIRKALKTKVPYLLVIGDKEAKSSKLHIRRRGDEAIQLQPKKQFTSQLLKEISERLPWTS
ncbi:MAG: threonine--tRNA ligase [Patescibacteria group bacterium]